jgi:ketosteroid isomerase-like protein
MSQENVEAVRRWYAAVSSGMEEAQSALAEFWDPDADYYPLRVFPEAQPCHGLEAVSLFVARYGETWSRIEYEVHELIEVGEDRVLAREHLRAEGRGSGVKTEGDHYTCVWLRHGRFLRVEDHLTLKGALHALGLKGDTLEAVGLSEQDAHADP